MREQLLAMSRDVSGGKSFSNRYSSTNQFVSGTKGLVREGFLIAIDGSEYLEHYLNSFKRFSTPVLSTTGSNVVKRVKSTIERALHTEGCGGCIYVMDLAEYKSKAKDCEYDVRRKDVVPMVSDGNSIYINDSEFPVGESWKKFKSNPYLRRQPNYYIFQSIWDDKLGPIQFHPSSFGSRDDTGDRKSKFLVMDGGIHPEHLYTNGYAHYICKKMTFEPCDTIVPPDHHGKGDRDHNIILDIKDCRDERDAESLLFGSGRRDGIDFRHSQGNNVVRTDLIRSRYVVPSSVGEGELAIFYHMGQNRERDVVIWSEDYDTTLIALLNSKDRLAEDGESFVNSVFIQSPGKWIDKLDSKYRAKRKKAEDKEAAGRASKRRKGDRGSVISQNSAPESPKQTMGNESDEQHDGEGATYVFIDINQLYMDIVAYYAKYLPSVQCPVETHCVMMMLSGTDFTSRTYASGIGHLKFFDYFKKNHSNYAEMVTRRDHIPMRLNASGDSMGVRYVHICPSIFTKFSEDMYVHYQKAVVSKYMKRKPQTITYSDIYECQGERMKEESRKPPHSSMFGVMSRNMTHLFLYWLNTYHFRLENPDYFIEFPCIAHTGRAPLWGYSVREEDNRAQISDSYDDEIDMSILLDLEF